MAAAGDSSSSNRFRVLDTTLVAPAAPAPPARSLPLTFLDVKWLHLPPVERVFFYRLTPDDADVAAILSGLRTSLSQALRAFYPLAGHVRILPSSNNNGRRRHELCYRPGDAVPFTTAAYDLLDDDIIMDSDGARPVRVAALAPLAPQLPKGRAVLAVQATLLLVVDRGEQQGRALALGVTVHHSACDGAASTHFLHTWAAAATRRSPPPPPPVIMDLIPDPRGLYDLYLKSLPPHDHPRRLRDKLLATFTLPHSLQQSIKAAVAGEAARRGITPPPRCSSMLAT
nr:unnamed protein product [Digitaria exilis]